MEQARRLSQVLGASFRASMQVSPLHYGMDAAQPVAQGPLEGAFDGAGVRRCPVESRLPDERRKRAAGGLRTGLDLTLFFLGKAHGYDLFPVVPPSFFRLRCDAR